MSDHSIIGGRAFPVNQIAAVFAMTALALILVHLTFAPRLLELWHQMFGPGIGDALANSDFVNYWFAGRLALAGDQMILFDPHGYLRLLREYFFPGYLPHNWSYPPHTLLLFLPIGLLGYKAGLVAFLGSTLALYVWAAKRFHDRFGGGPVTPLYLAAHLAFVAANLATTQNGFLTGALFLIFLCEHDRRPVAAALAIALLTIKPQLGILIPVMLAFSRSWNLIALATMFSLAFVAVSLVAFGLEPWRQYVEVVIPFQRRVVTEWEGGFLMLMPTVVAALRILGVDGESAMTWQFLYSILCLPLAVFALWRTRAAPTVQRGFVLLLSTFCIAPYAFNYDMGPLVAAAALILSRADRGFAETVLCWVVCLLPVCVVVFAAAGLPAVPIVLLASLLIVLRETWKVTLASDAAGRDPRVPSI